MGSLDHEAHKDHRDPQAHLDFLGKMDNREAEVKVVPRDLQDSQDYRESLVLREKRVILGLDFLVLQVLLDLQVNPASPPGSWRDLDLKTLTVMQRF